jgi:hypothetical protein
MKSDRPLKIDAPAVPNAAPEVWWGEDGIDALLWADPTPYEPQVSEAPAEPPTLPRAEAIQ